MGYRKEALFCLYPLELIAERDVREKFKGFRPIIEVAPKNDDGMPSDCVRVTITGESAKALAIALVRFGKPVLGAANLGEQYLHANLR